MHAIKPLATTLRTLEWDDLPASVRSIPEGFNPLDDGVLMKHQREVAAIQAAIIAVPKGRRTGITFGTMLDKTLVAAARKSAGGDNVYYIGDTKEKGLEAIGYCAKFARVIAQAQGQGGEHPQLQLAQPEGQAGQRRAGVGGDFPGEGGIQPAQGAAFGFGQGWMEAEGQGALALA